jgi:hypothetical protein
MKEIFVNLTCINQTPVYSKHIHWFQGGSVQTGFTMFIFLDVRIPVYSRFILNRFHIYLAGLTPLAKNKET